MERTLEFLVIGAQKSGTTALFHHLAAHPGLYLPAGKELPYFSRADIDADGLRSFINDYYGGAASSRLRGKVSPQYMAHPQAATRIAQWLPEVRLIAILRHPVERALSHYRMLRLRGRIASSAATALEGLLDPATAAASRLLPSGADSEARCLLAWGEYGRILGRYLEHFPRERLLVVFQDELEQAPERLLARMWDFLQVQHFLPPTVGQRFHVGAERQRWPWLDRVARSPATRALGTRLISPARRKAFGFRLQQMNIAAAQGAEITLPEELRARLIDYFREDVATLESKLDLRVPWHEFRHAPE